MQELRTQPRAEARTGADAKLQGKARAAQRQKEILTRLYYRTEETEDPEDLFSENTEERDEGGVDDECVELQADQDDGDDPRASDNRERDPFCSQTPALRALSHVIWLWRPPVLLWSVDSAGQWRCSEKRERVRRRLEKLFQVQGKYFPFLSSPRDLEGMLLQEWFAEPPGGNAGEGRDEDEKDGEPSEDGGARRDHVASNLAFYTLKDLSIFLCQKDGTPEENPWFPVGLLFSGQGQRGNSVPVALEVRWLQDALRDHGLGLKDVGKRVFWKNHGAWLLEAHGDFRRRMGKMLQEGLGRDSAPDLAVSEETLKKNLLGRWRNFIEKNCAPIEQEGEA